MKDSLPQHPVTVGLPLWGESQESIVYYISRGDLIKIGTTAYPEARFASLIPDAILAFEPGDRMIEAARHRQFARLRQGRGEYFRRSPALMRHIEKTRTSHGAPDPHWATTATIGRRYRYSHQPVTDPPKSVEVGSGAQVARTVGVHPDTVRQWAHRGHIKPAPGSKPNKPLYFVDDARKLAEKSSRSPYQKFG
jgi:hypothetical protein